MDHNNSSSLWGDSGTVSALAPGAGTIRSGTLLHPFLFRRRTGQLLSADRPGSVPLLPLYRIFPLWTDSSG